MSKSNKQDLTQLSDEELAQRKKLSLIIFASLLFIISASLLTRVFMSYTEGGYEGPEFLIAFPFLAMVAFFFGDRYEKAKKEIKRRAQQARA